MPAMKKKDFIKQVIMLRRFESMFVEVMRLKRKFTGIETLGKKS
jgi:hypothetical protein